MLGQSVQKIEAQQSLASAEIMQLRARLLDVLTQPAAPQRASRLDRLERLNRLYRRLESLEKNVGREQAECVRMLEVVLSAVEKNSTAMGVLSQTLGKSSVAGAGQQALGMINRSTVSQPLLNRFMTGQAQYGNSPSQPIDAWQRSLSHLAAQPQHVPTPSSSSETLRVGHTAHALRVPEVPQSPWTGASHPTMLNSMGGLQQPSVGQSNIGQQPGITIVLDSSLVQTLGQTPAPRTVAFNHSRSEAAPASPLALPLPPRPAAAAKLSGNPL